VGHFDSGLHAVATDDVYENFSAKRRVESLAAMQSALGLPMQTLAEILRVSRAQLYKWLDVSIASRFKKKISKGRSR